MINNNTDTYDSGHTKTIHFFLGPFISRVHTRPGAMYQVEVGVRPVDSRGIKGAVCFY